MRTRLGFAKNGPATDLNRDGAPASGRPGQGASTVAGRAPLLPPDALAPGPAQPAPARATPPGPSPAADPDPAPLHTGKSNFPAVVGFWGRRDDNGDLIPLTDPRMLARSWGRRAQLGRLLRNLAVVMASAVLGFLAVYGVMELRQRRSPPPAPVAPVATPPAATVPVPAPPSVAPPSAPAAAPARPRVRKRPARTPRPARDEDVLMPRL